MGKIAKLVCVSLMTRIIVEDTATDDEIDLVIAEQRSIFKDKIDNELFEHIESVEDDTEMPYEVGEEYKDKFGFRLAKGNSVMMPERQENDMWNYSFGGHIEEFSNGYAVVMDGDGDCFTVECNRLEKLIEE